MQTLASAIYDEYGYYRRQHRESARLRIVTPPSGTVVDLAEAKEYARIETTVDDAVLLPRLLQAATDAVEAHLRGRKLLTQTWEAAYDHSPPAAFVPLPALRPLQSISAVGTYNAAGVFTTFSNTAWVLDNSDAERGILRLVDTTTAWPIGDRSYAPFAIRFNVGYGVDAAVPDTIKLAIETVFALYYDDRSAMAAELPPAVQGMLAPFRVWALGG